MMKDKLRFYWFIEVDTSIAKDGCIHLMADAVEIIDGNLIFKDSSEKGCGIVFAISKGKWSHFYAASLIDGTACCVELWKQP
jgi:hypothetical protein